MSEPSSHSVPSWIWLFTGVATGLFLAFLYYLAGIQTPLGDAASTEISSKTSDTSNSPAFDFYNLLPDVIISTPDAKTPGTKSPGTMNSLSSKTQNGQTTISALLQTGAFSLPNDADRRKAELLLLGLTVNIETVDIKGQTYHRVQVGPFDSKQALAQAKQLLSQNGIDHLQRQLNPSN